MRLPTRSFGPLMGSAVRTAMPELSGGVGRMRVLLMRYMTSRPLPRAISGSMTELPASSALPPNTASTPSAPWEMKFQVTSRFCSLNMPFSRATSSTAKLAMPWATARILVTCCAGAGTGASANTAAAAKLHLRTVERIDIVGLPLVVVSGPAAALSMPSDQPALYHQKQAIEHVAEQRQCEDAGIHVRHLEGVLRQQHERAQPVIGNDHLAEDREDQRDREADAHAGQDLRTGGG